MMIFAMIFPGQGSQSIGMLKELAKDHAIVKATFSEASTILKYDLWRCIQEGPTEKLNKTWITQPALLASSVAIWRVWKQHGGQTPAFMAGHSLGEYSALVCAGSLNFLEAIRLVTLRGKLMQEAVPLGSGAMSVIIGLNEDIVGAICKKTGKGQVVAPVNFNAPNQIVIAGHKEAVKRASLACKEVGAKRTLLLPISVPSHCTLMRPAAEKLAIALEKVTFLSPYIPIINNVDAQIEKHPKAICQALVRQLYNPVRWTESVKYLASKGVKMLLEIGPKAVLTYLTTQINSSLSSKAIFDTVSLKAALNTQIETKNEFRKSNCDSDRR